MIGLLIHNTALVSDISSLPYIYSVYEEKNFLMYDSCIYL